MFENQPPLSLEEGLVETTTGVYDMRDDEQKRRMVSDGLIYYIAEVKAEIIQQDPTALITMGFFAPGAAPDWYVETGSLLEGADLDFFDFHAYPGWETVAELVQAFGMNGFASKPIILGEYGAFQHVYPTLKTAARAITAWQAASCDFGFDGWLYWAYYPADESVEDRTWGLVDDSGFFLDMLAPVSHPNPCELVDIPSENLAYQKPARASASLMENPPANLVDENASSQWSAGKDAPQWIEIDLGQPYAIQEIRLLVAQWPEGNTSHRILGRSRDGNFMELHRFSQSTTEGNWLVFSPEDLIQDIQIVRIETMSSPSWVAWGEVEIFGELIP
ncbi:MAG: discoidin domain-containing protein [Anaerolineales bacterium]|nr:MAG: discoidin domain-containing protein [Anaerolineales bacterium]